MPKEELVYVGIKGTVMALSSTTGQILWQTVLKGGDFIHLVLDGDNLFAGTKGEVFCLDPATGHQRWCNPLKGFGFGLASIVTRNGSTNSATLMAEQRQQEQQSSGRTAAASNIAGAAR